MCTLGSKITKYLLRNDFISKFQSWIICVPVSRCVGNLKKRLLRIKEHCPKPWRNVTNVWSFWRTLIIGACSKFSRILNSKMLKLAHECFTLLAGKCAFGMKCKFDHPTHHTSAPGGCSPTIEQGARNAGMLPPSKPQVKVRWVLSILYKTQHRPLYCCCVRDVVTVEECRPNLVPLRDLFWKLVSCPFCNAGYPSFH